MMIRTQIYLPRLLHQRIKSLAKKEDVTMAEKIREVLDENIRENGESEEDGYDLFEELAALKIKGGPKDLSENMDYYLYSEGRDEK